MCRWLGHLGSPIEPRELLYDPERSLIDQSRQLDRRSLTAVTVRSRSRGCTQPLARRDGAT